MEALWMCRKRKIRKSLKMRYKVKKKFRSLMTSFRMETKYQTNFRKKRNRT